MEALGQVLLYPGELYRRRRALQQGRNSPPPQFIARDLVLDWSLLGDFSLWS